MEALRLADENGLSKFQIVNIEAFAQLVVRRGDPEIGFQLLAATETARIEFGLLAPPVHRAAIDEAVAQAHHVTPEHVAAAAWAEGEAMSLDAAVEYLLTR